MQNNHSNQMPRYKKPKHNDSDYPNNVEEEDKIVTSNNANLSKESYNYAIASIKKSLKESKRLLHIPIGIQEQISFAESNCSTKRQNAEILPIMLNFLSKNKINTKYLIDMLQTSIRYIQNNKNPNEWIRLCIIAKYQLIWRLIRKVYYKYVNSMKCTEEGMLVWIDDEDREYKSYREIFPLGKTLRNEARQYMRKCVQQILNGERIKVYELFSKYKLDN